MTSISRRSLLPAGLVLVRRGTFASPAARLATSTAALFALAVLATQYPVGGSMEWGGRFFHVGLPLVVPVLLLAVAAARRRQRTNAGTRQPPSQLVFFSERNGVMPASGQVL